MEKELHEQYEYARNRIKQKKRLYYHFVFLMLFSIFLIVAAYFFDTGLNIHWCIWGITLWLFFFILHFIKVFITDRFMNKNWEREQIDRLVDLQQKKIDELKEHLNEENPTK